MLNYVTVEHVHPDVVGELKLDLEVFPGIKVPGLLHRFISSVRTRKPGFSIRPVDRPFETNLGKGCWVVSGKKAALGGRIFRSRFAKR
jgi:hypothetical protein